MSRRDYISYSSHIALRLLAPSDQNVIATSMRMSLNIICIKMRKNLLYRYVKFILTLFRNELVWQNVVKGEKKRKNWF